MTLLLPSDVPPAYTCICGKKFYSVPVGQRHAAHCSEADTMVGEAYEARTEDAFSGYLDREARTWIDKRLAEGKPGTKRGRPA